MLNYKSYDDLSRDIAGNLQKLPLIDIVVGIPKSGLVPAVMIASFKNVKFYDLDSFLFAYSNRSGRRKYGTASPAKMRALVVDDSVNTGAEFERVRARLSSLNDDFEFVFCAVYGRDPTERASAADIILSYVPQPRFFQWNYRNHIVAEHALFDMDGVLCVDPEEHENDDGEAYLNFIANAAQLTIPTKSISAIVTSRLEKYRAQTEDWLERNGVRYRELIMLDLPSAEERRRLRAHAPFKAEVYKSRDEYLFVESNWKQAQHIASAADKAVICTENDILVYGKKHLASLEKANKLISPSAMNLQIDLQLKNKLLVDRIASIDPYAGTWLKQSGIKIDQARIDELSPFHKVRLVTSSARLRSAPAIAAKTTASRILMISTTFDVKIGAGAAASSSRLREALKAAGYDVYTLATEDFPDRKDAPVDQPSSGTHMGFWINYADGEHSRNLLERVATIDPDCIVLGAIDRGILSMFDIAKLRYPIVWVNRDNWAHTGGCLFKLPSNEIEEFASEYEGFFPGLTCEHYKAGCQECPALKDIRESGKTRTSYEIKRAVMSYRSDIVLAPISPWLAELLRSSPITRNNDILPVCNPIDLSIVRRLPSRPSTIRSRLGLGKDHKLVLLAAHSLSNPRKGLKLALDTLAKDNRFRNVTFLTMGQDKLQEKHRPKGVNVHSLGFVATEEEKVAIYNEVDATLVPALQESLSVVASDSICCGTPVVAFGTSGLKSFLRHKETGYLARPFARKDLMDGLNWVLYESRNEELSDACLNAADEIFSAKRNTSAFSGVIEQAIANFKSLKPIPPELEMLSNAMELVNDDHRFRHMASRSQIKKIREFAELKALTPELLSQKLDIKGKVDEVYRSIKDLEKNYTELKKSAATKKKKNEDSNKKIAKTVTNENSIVKKIRLAGETIFQYRRTK
ncbi:phosphoribosyl transferase-like protein [Rhizobium subbaraonis]|uniref:Phosphoribosyl transferase-like protein n=1 Tax=Rhizobium subbaraonis TaxID=908946 RepID=A0A285UXM0_9HYPH|nr:glycosyltransferase [Rhizobium subbaraonis]SOC46108.1 phosphoribosyl transferase-like protein [Rhizobium subbaraonis]